MEDRREQFRNRNLGRSDTLVKKRKRMDWDKPAAVEAEPSAGGGNKSTFADSQGGAGIAAFDFGTDNTDLIPDPTAPGPQSLSEGWDALDPEMYVPAARQPGVDPLAVTHHDQVEPDQAHRKEEGVEDHYCGPLTHLAEGLGPVVESSLHDSPLVIEVEEDEDDWEGPEGFGSEPEDPIA